MRQIINNHISKTISEFNIQVSNISTLSTVYLLFLENLRMINLIKTYRLYIGIVYF